MKNKYFNVKLSENIVIGATSGKITRNSNGSQWISVELDGWKLGEDEKLYIMYEWENEDEQLTTRVGSLLLFYNFELDKYVALIPPEVISKAGIWKYSIEKRFDIVTADDGEMVTNVTTVTDADGNIISETVTKHNNQDKLVFNSITSSVAELEITDTVILHSETDEFVKESELISAANNFESTRLQVEENRRLTEQAFGNAKAAQRAAEYAQSETEAARNEAVSAVRDAQFAYNNSVYSTTVAYRVSDSGTECPTGEWSETIPEAKAGQYLWTRTTYLFNDGSTKDAYSIGKMGNNGFYALTNGLFSFRVDDESNLYCDFVDNGKEDSPKFKYDEETGNLFYIIDDNIPDNGTVITPGTIYLGNLKGRPGTPGTDGDPGTPGKSAYVLAVENGFVGTLEEWLASLHGTDGKNGQDGQNGADGAPGADGTKLTNVNTIKYEDRGMYTDSTVRVYTTTGNRDFIVYAKNGTDGADGVGIKSVGINDKGELIITPTIGESVNLGKVVGKDGADGAPGTPGADGAPGAPGADGKDGETPHIGENGNWWLGDVDTGIHAQGEPGRPGQDGAPGAPGADGKDGETPYIKDGNWWIGDKDTGVSAGGYIIGDGIFYGTAITIKFELFELTVQLQTPVKYNTKVSAVPALGDTTTIASPEFISAFKKALEILYAAGFDGTNWTTNVEGFSYWYFSNGQVIKDTVGDKPQVKAAWAYGGNVLNTTVDRDGTTQEMRINEDVLKYWHTNNLETWGVIKIISREYPSA